MRTALTGCEKLSEHIGISLVCTFRGTEVQHAGCSKRPSSKAAASEEARRTLRYVEPLSDARTKLADFFSILLEPLAVLAIVLFFGFVDPLVPLDPVGGGAEFGRNLLHSGGVAPCDLSKGHDAHVVEHPLERRSDAADLFEVVFRLRR